jgi:hypothetical protein
MFLCCNLVGLGVRGGVGGADSTSYLKQSTRCVIQKVTVCLSIGKYMADLLVGHSPYAVPPYWD